MGTYKFEGVDRFNRPVFKRIDGQLRIGSIDILIPNEELGLNSKESITEYFKENKTNLVYFGSSFGCEPDGSKLNYDNIIIE